MAQIFGLQV